MEAPGAEADLLVAGAADLAEAVEVLVDLAAEVSAAAARAEAGKFSEAESRSDGE